ncbi:MAG: hypothetical protein JXA90_11880, partial [Planctomycetes bacterium]|nr:hypothetical protein [Planctomycetota bacterium]
MRGSSEVRGPGSKALIGARMVLLVDDRVESLTVFIEVFAMRRIAASSCLSAVLVLCWGGLLSGQSIEGRIFLPTEDTLAIWEMNDLPGSFGDVVPSGTLVPDLSGHGLDAVVEANSNTLVAGEGDDAFHVPPGDPSTQPNTTVSRVNGTAPPRLAVNSDGGVFEFTETDDFTVELYVRRAEAVGGEQWGILAGTWHSRTLIDDGGNPDTDGAWYGWGFIQRGGSDPAGWVWVCSGVNPDGSLIQTGHNEGRNDAAWEIPAGSHYVVASVDRTEQMVRVYLDGALVETFALNPNWSFVTPNGYEHARFIMLTGEDDSTRNAYRPAPSGYAIDAARIQKKALLENEVEDNWLWIWDGLPAPPEAPSQAVVTASSTVVVAGQCVLLSGEASSAGEGLTITQFEWKIGDGPFEVGDARKEVSFASPSGPEGIEVTLRVTDSGGGVSTSSLKITVNAQAVTADLGISIDGQPLGGDEIIVPAGTVLALDATGSTSVLPAGAVECPIDLAIPLEPDDITSYSWDTDGDGSEDSALAALDLGPLDAEGAFTITLTVENEEGSTDSASVAVQVVAATGNSQVFHTTPDTILHLEFNNLEPGVLEDPDSDGDVGGVPDLTEFGRDMTLVDPIEDPDVRGLEVQGGAVHFAENRAITNIADGNGHRGEIRDDEGAFEMGPGDDFTFEIYVRPSENVLPQWGDVAGTFKARTDGTENSPRYGWGIIKSHLDQEGKSG